MGTSDGAGRRRALAGGRGRSSLAAILFLLPGAAAAQDEASLRTALEGRQLTVTIDMPASHRGVDLRFDREEPFDVSENASRIRQYDVGIPEGRRAQVTRVKVKDDLIEVHLGGGGFNWGSDTTTQTFTASSKSSRESDLDKRIRDETDASRKRELQRERDDLRRQRERRDDRRRNEVEEHNRDARERDRERSLRSGSRFNLRFRKRVLPEALTAEGMLRYLERWASASGVEPGVAGDPGGGEAGRAWLHKGLSREDVEVRLGRPRRETPCGSAADDLRCAVALYDDGPDELEATFVEDVLVRFTARGR